MIERNFAAIVGAYAGSCQQIEALEGQVQHLAQPLIAYAKALRTLGPKGEDAEGLSDVEIAALEQAEEAWRSPPERPSVSGRAGPSTQPATQAAASPETSRAQASEPPMFEVTVPEGAGPGDSLFLELGSGEQIKVVVPEGAAPGYTLTCEFAGEGNVQTSTQRE
uniref:Uncharacterized protein n=1 Tax=Haptolina ericina TaxID=156174 RepID=A0A7S3ACK4_9EUKA